jgi:FkbM family methyltransferase
VNTPFLSRVFRRVLGPTVRAAKAKLHIDTPYKYSRFSILLPADHLLPVYQREHPRYDRFLPELGRHLAPGATVIDVGANCGDTLAAMYDANRALSYICIEPDDAFFRYLQINAGKIRSANHDASIQTIKALVGKAVGQATLSGSGGTKHAVALQDLQTGGTTIISSTLDSLRSLPGMDTVQLLKSDVDGFDYDVLDSAEDLILEQHPILFFECDFANETQKTSYGRTLSGLFAKGYSKWVVFDNYGEVLLETGDLSLITQLFDYLERQKSGFATRTIVYLDLLAYTPRHAATVEAAVKAYIE